MANPFPGMDPFLELPSRWPSIHQRFITYLADTIDPLLPANYSADIGERVYVTSPPKNIYPDVFVSKTTLTKKEHNGRTTTAVMEADPAVEIEFPPTEMREPFIEIRFADDVNTLIGVIEVLSPANKTPGDGRDLYREKQRRLLQSQAHFMEIDLLRAGEHTVGIPREQIAEDGWDYLVCLHRAGWRNKFHVWPIELSERLPRVNIPLTGNDADVVVDLQAVLNQCHAAGKGRRIDYNSKCPPPLSKKNTKWIDDLLRKKKLRK